MDIPIPLQFVVIAMIAVPASLYFFVQEVRRNPAMAFALCMLYSALTKSISVLYLDLSPGIYITESATCSKYVGASWRFFMYNLLIFGAAALTTRLLSGRLKMPGFKGGAPARAAGRGRMTSLVAKQVLRSPSDLYIKLFLGIVAAILLMEVANLGLSRAIPLPGSPATRWNYWELYARFPILASVFGKLMIGIPATLSLILVNTQTPERREMSYFAWGLLILFAMVLALTGQRFNGFIVPTVIALAIYGVHCSLTRRPVITARLLMAGCVFVVAGLSYAVVEFQSRGVTRITGSAGSGVLYRVLVLQGHTYWNCDALSQVRPPTWRMTDFFNGMETVIDAILDPALIDVYKDATINLAAGYPATSLLVVGPWVSIPMNILLGVALGLLWHMLFMATRDGRLLAVYCSASLWLWSLSLYTQGSLVNVMEPKFILCFIVVAFVLRSPQASLGLERRGSKKLPAKKLPAKKLGVRKQGILQTPADTGALSQTPAPAFAAQRARANSSPNLRAAAARRAAVHSRVNPSRAAAANPPANSGRAVVVRNLTRTAPKNLPNSATTNALEPVASTPPPEMLPV